MGRKTDLVLGIERKGCKEFSGILPVLRVLYRIRQISMFIANGTLY